MANSKKGEKKRSVLGSGKIYRMDFTGDTIPAIEDICKEENRFTNIKGGASLEYTKETLTEEDDLGEVSKTVITAEDVVLKLGVMTFYGDTLKYLIETARREKTDDGTKYVTKIGGISNADNTSYVWCFHHEDKKDGDIWVLIVGKNQAGCTFDFKKDGATVLNAEIKAEPLDNEGTKVLYYEETTSE